ncbi:hypothetical protein PMZ80_008758 [Knufia obscura]|uniref:RRM domain-containing protein n=1 Tax=Knufia obscura TaxID=1635080 RepID=A0ABR0REE1_9EURO|nr:hypothetical protein PMZ80_008758 [Knufia obscura]
MGVQEESWAIPKDVARAGHTQSQVMKLCDDMVDRGVPEAAPKATKQASPTQTQWTFQYEAQYCAKDYSNTRDATQGATSSEHVPYPHLATAGCTSSFSSSSKVRHLVPIKNWSRPQQVGYAFINFVDPMAIVPFAKARAGQKWNLFQSDKIAEISYVRVQGVTYKSTAMGSITRIRPIVPQPYHGVIGSGAPAGSILGPHRTMGTCLFRARRDLPSLRQCTVLLQVGGRCPRFIFIGTGHRPEAKAKRICQQKAVEHGLNMEVLDAEFQMDGKKLTF